MSIDQNKTIEFANDIIADSSAFGTRHNRAVALVAVIEYVKSCYARKADGAKLAARMMWRKRAEILLTPEDCDAIESTGAGVLSDVNLHLRKSASRFDSDACAQPFFAVATGALANG